MTLHKQKTKHGWGEQISHKVSVSNTDTKLLQWLVDTTGLGAIKPQWQNPSPKQERFNSRNIKPLFVWALWATGIRQLLPQILPFLVCKRRHAELMLESVDLTKRRVGREYAGKGKGYPLNEEAKQRRREIASEMKQLNQRGIKDGS